MILSIWKPQYSKGKVIYYDFLGSDNTILNDLRGKTAYKVLWVCDDKSCNTANKTHSISACHLKKEKMSNKVQICRPCQCRGVGNGRYGDNRTWEDIMGKDKSNDLKLMYREKWVGKNNPSHYDDVKLKKNQTIINLNNIIKSLNKINFKLIKVNNLDGKNTKITVQCSQGHVSEKTYSNLFKKDKKYRCSICFYSDISLNLSDDELKLIENYKKQVRALTAKTYRKYKSEINHNNLKIGRGHYHIDHIYSLHMGYKNNVDVKVMASKENLRVISEYENCSKQSRCDIKLNELIEKTKYLY